MSTAKTAQEANSIKSFSKNPNQFDGKTNNITVDQVRFIQNAVSGGSCDSYSHIAEVLGIKPSFLLIDEPLRAAIEAGEVSPEAIYQIILCFCGTTAAGQQSLLDMSLLLPVRNGTDRP